MPKRDGFDHGVPAWVDLATTDVEVAKAFYRALFGWEWIGSEMPDGAGTYWMGALGGALTAGLAAQAPDMAQQGLPSMWNTYVNVTNVEETTARAAAAGATVMAAPMQVGEAGRMSVVMDPGGAAIGMWEPGEHKGAGIVNEYGALIWNELYTPDVNAGIAFYGEVFGWTTGQMDTPGGGTYTTFHVGEPAVGGITTPPAEQVPTHWHVWFGSNDVDATAARALELGAGQLVEPTDTPIGKIAGFHDPTGAVFSIITAPDPG